MSRGPGRLKDVQISQNREVAVNFSDKGYGKRPDVIQFENDVYELAKRINNHELHPEIMKLLEKFVDKVNNTQIRLSKRYYG